MSVRGTRAGRTSFLASVMLLVMTPMNKLRIIKLDRKM